jgi:hypothetical protein
MVSLLGIVAGIALVLAVIVTALVVGVCLLVSWTTNAFRSGGGRPARLPRSAGSTPLLLTPVSRPRAPTPASRPLPSSPDSSRRTDTGAPAGYRRP